MPKSNTSENTNSDVTKITSLINPTAPIFSIGIIATMLGVHQRTLRIYDDEKLLVPQRTSKNRRLYSIQDVERGKFIQYLTRELGINLSGVRIIFNLLEQLKIEPSKHAEYVQNIAKDLDITQEEQALTKQKLSKRGRKSKND